MCTGEAPDSKQRRLNMIKAVEGDDWSAVIDSQTQQTIEGVPATCSLSFARDADGCPLALNQVSHSQLPIQQWKAAFAFSVRSRLVLHHRQGSWFPRPDYCKHCCIIGMQNRHGFSLKWVGGALQPWQLTCRIQDLTNTA